MKKKPAAAMMWKLQKSVHTSGTVSPAACLTSASVAFSTSGRYFFRRSA